MSWFESDPIFKTFGVLINMYQIEYLKKILILSISWFVIKAFNHKKSNHEIDEIIVFSKRCSNSVKFVFLVQV